MKHVIFGLLNGISFLIITTPALAQDADQRAGATFEPPTDIVVPLEYKPALPKTTADKLITSGAVLTVVGGLTTIVGGALFGASANEIDACNDNYDEEDSGQNDWCGWGAGMVGIPMGIMILGIGGTMFITGVVLLSVGLAKRKNMKRDKLAVNIKTKHGKLTLEPAIAAGETGGVFGLSGRF